MGAVIVFSLLLTTIEWPTTSWLLAAGRRLEVRIRLRFFEQVPRLGDRYFDSHEVGRPAQSPGVQRAHRQTGSRR